MRNNSHYGGRRFGAGFDSGTLSGDHCTMASVRLRWTQAGRAGTGAQGRLSLYGALDAGWVRQQGTLEAGERRSSSASSASIGARFILLPGLNVELQAAWPLSFPEGESHSEARFNLALGHRF